MPILKGIKSLDNSGDILGVCLTKPTPAEFQAKDFNPRLILWINKPEGGERRALEVRKNDLLEALGEAVEEAKEPHKEKNE